MAFRSNLKKFIPGKVIFSSSNRLLSGFGLAYERFGEPVEVLKKIPIKHERALKGNQVKVKYLASPINPADINTIQGVYPIKPAEFPAIGGNEGFGEITAVGPNVRNIKVGDKIVPLVLASGTWITESVLTEKEVCVLNPDVNTLFASQITVNPCTAYRMLKDFVNLQPQDTIIQNGAGSAVGVNVIQLARIFNFRTINVIRDRDLVEMAEAKSNLKALGADVVISESELVKKELMDNIFSRYPKPKLALNCVGWEAATNCSRHLADDGIMVTYGGMSKKPVVIATGSFIFKNHSYVGFWMTRWRQQNSLAKLQNMFEELIEYNNNGQLLTPKINEVSINDYKEVFEILSSGKYKGKYVFRF